MHMYLPLDMQVHVRVGVTDASHIYMCVCLCVCVYTCIYLSIYRYMSVAESLTLAIPFAVSHNFEDSERDPIAESRLTGQPVDWYKSQVGSRSTSPYTLNPYIYRDI
jgi:hypothetical protein